MERAQYTVWDRMENKFFQNIYQPKKPDAKEYVRELLLTMSGELYLRIVENGLEICVHESQMEPNRFIVVPKLSERDCNQKRYYLNDIVKFTDAENRSSYGVLIWDKHFGSLAIGSGPIDNYTAIDPINAKELAAQERFGNIYQDYKIIMGPDWTPKPWQKPETDINNIIETDDVLKTKGLID